MTAFEDQLTALDQIYQIYDQFSATLDLACKKYCAHCCTADATLTTLEGYKIVVQLISKGESKTIEAIQSATARDRFQPQITTNQLADLCIADIEPPAEEKPQESHPCPFIIDNQCPLYSVRPFGCRCLVSRHDCGEKGYAAIDDFVLSVNTVFLQTIEHVDRGGCTGNMIDVLSTMASEQNREAYEKNLFDCGVVGLISNRPLKALMVPPEHQGKMEPILQQLRRI